MKINLAGGRGPMGTTHKPLFERAGHQVIISGRNTIPSLEDAATQSDITIVSVPIPATRGIIARIAPYCSAIMDFTGVKQDPIKAMYEYTPENCEIGGMHPLYKDFAPGRTVVYCPTKRSGERCAEVVRSLELAGAKIKIMIPDAHDRAMDPIQNKRRKMLENFGLSLESTGMSIEEAYQLSPPPTRVLLDLLARQIDPSNAELYQAMEDYNPYSASSRSDSSTVTPVSQVSARLRTFFGEQLKPAQERAKKLIS